MKDDAFIIIKSCFRCFVTLTKIAVGNGTESVGKWENLHMTQKCKWGISLPFQFCSAITYLGIPSYIRYISSTYPVSKNVLWKSVGSYFVGWVVSISYLVMQNNILPHLKLQNYWQYHLIFLNPFISCSLAQKRMTTIWWMCP